MIFQTIADDEHHDLVDYLKKYIKKTGIENIKLYVGCDSQNKQTSTVYATTVVIHIGNMGCHVLYQREIIRPVIYDLWNRLWKEVEKSVEVALYLRENNIHVDNWII
jgi:predicted RNase H-related nuclease YkuK (DUF458 family)